VRRRAYIDPSDLSLLQTLGLPAAGSATRASDAERERAADALRRHHGDGRLSTDELEQRTGRAYAATTLGDLDQLFADLPRLRSPERERRPRRGLRPPALALPLIALLFAVALAASAHALFFIWPLIFFLLLRLALMRPGWWRRAHSRPEAYRHY
jgi:Flp pilus assembly protein TadB